MSRKTEMYDVTVTICRACMTRTPPNVRRRLTGGAQVGPSEGILRHTQGQNKTSCWMCSAEVSGLIAHQAQMPQHLSCRHIYGDCQEFIFGPFSLHQCFIQADSRWFKYIHVCILQVRNIILQAKPKIPTMSRRTEMYDVTVTICRACMTRTPPNVRRRLTGGAQVGPSEGILRHTQGQNKTSCWMCSAEVSGLIAHQAQMPQHLSCRHIYGDCQEFIFGPFSLHQCSSQADSRWFKHIHVCILQVRNIILQAKPKIPTMSRRTEMYDVTVTICRACMTRTPPTVRRRLTGRALFFLSAMNSCSGLCLKCWRSIPPVETCGSLSILQFKAFCRWAGILWASPAFSGSQDPGHKHAASPTSGCSQWPATPAIAAWFCKDWAQKAIQKAVLDS